MDNMTKKIDNLGLNSCEIYLLPILGMQILYRIIMHLLMFRRNPKVGYCQGMNMIVLRLLDFLN